MHLFKLAALALCGFAASSAQASTSNAGYVSHVIVLANGIALFDVGGSRSAPPACATYPARWALNATTAAGQARFAQILTAYSAHRQITVLGMHNCSDWSDTESVEFATTVD